MASESHSDKGLKTIELMNTVAADWGLVEIIWKQEKRNVPTRIRCPLCEGRGNFHADKKGKPVKNKLDRWKGYSKWLAREKEIEALPEVTCPKCLNKNRDRADWNRTQITIWKVRLVWVGYPQWHKKNCFRFAL